VPSASMPVTTRRTRLALAGTAAGLVVGATAGLLGAVPAAAAAGAPLHPAAVSAPSTSATAATLTAFSTVARPDPAHQSVHTVAAAQAALETTPAKKTVLAKKTVPAKKAVPTERQLIPTGTSGPQQYMTLGTAQLQNARTIVQQAMHKGMGVRSAVIAVATAMQESQLLNINYGTYESLGLFQQQPDCGWGTATQIMNPVYASDAFLNGLSQYQAGNPGWATQPLWQAAQGVQNSGYPYAYAKWEVQAAHIVATVAHGMF